MTHRYLPSLIMFNSPTHWPRILYLCWYNCIWEQTLSSVAVIIKNSRLHHTRWSRGGNVSVCGQMPWATAHHIISPQTVYGWFAQPFQNRSLQKLDRLYVWCVFRSLGLPSLFSSITGECMDNISCTGVCIFQCGVHFHSGKGQNNFHQGPCCSTYQWRKVQYWRQEQDSKNHHLDPCWTSFTPHFSLIGSAELIKGIWGTRNGMAHCWTLIVQYQLVHC